MSTTATETETKVGVNAATEKKEPAVLRNEAEMMAEVDAKPEVHEIEMPEHDSKTRELARIVNTGDIDIMHLSKQERDELTAFGKKLDVHDINTVTNFGSELQRAMNDTSKTILSSSRRSKVGDVTEGILREMMSQVKEIDIDEIHAPSKIQRFLRKLPIIGGLFSTIEKFMEKYESLEATVEKCERNLHAVNIKAKADNSMLQRQFDDTNEYIALLEKFIVAGKIKSNELGVVIDKMENDSSYDSIEIAKVKDFKHDLDLRLTNMLTWRTTFMQSLWRIYQIQKANVALSNNVQDTVDSMMPMLRHQLSEAVALYNLQQGIKVVDVVQKGFNDILAHNADMTHDAVVAVREQTENTAVRMETLRHTQERLVATMRDAQRVCEQGAAKRREQEKELAKMNVELDQLATGTERAVYNKKPTAKEIEAKYAATTE